MNYVTIDTTKAEVTITEESGAVTTITTPSCPLVITTFTEGPQGPSGISAGALPTGGDPGNILIKNTNANYDTSWTPTLDGGTFN